MDLGFLINLSRGLKILLNRKPVKLFIILYLTLLLLQSTGCSKKDFVPPSSVYSQFPIIKEEKAEEDRLKISPRAQASLQLTNQGLALLQSSRPDDAIRIFERSISLDTYNGQNYYYMAEAWIMKDNKQQAMEFNQLAEIYLKLDANWTDWEILVAKQREWR